ncbi:MAG: GEVED domain-containing protein, partial [Sphingomonadales bacterium]
MFTDPGELVYTSTAATNGPHIETGVVAVPPTATQGITRMRVVNVETTVTTGVNPCGTYTWGETEDYFVQIAA